MGFYQFQGIAQIQKWIYSRNYLTGVTVRFKKLIIKTNGLLAELKSGKTITNLRDLVEIKSEPTSTWNEIVSGYGRFSIPALLLLAVIFFIIGILFH
jgi:hypothetical protein